MAAECGKVPNLTVLGLREEFWRTEGTLSYFRFVPWVSVSPRISSKEKIVSLGKVSKSLSQIANSLAPEYCLNVQALSLCVKKFPGLLLGSAKTSP